MPAKKPKLTVKQAKFVKAVAEGKPGYKAAMEAYDTNSPNVANTIAVENMQKPTIMEALHIEFEKQGITLEKIVKPVANALDSEDIELQLKGHDRAWKMIAPKTAGNGTTINNFGTIVGEMKDDYAD